MIKMLHSTWAILVLLMLIVAVVNAVIGLTSKKSFGEKDIRIPLFTLIVSHIQLLIGLIAYFSSAQFAHMREEGMGLAMKDPDIRMITVEHPLMMIIALVLITIGFSAHKKKTTDKAKFKTIAVYYGIALLLVLSRIPWNHWFN